MEEKWYLKPVDNVNRMLRVRNDLTDEYIASKFKNLLVVKHQYHIADDIMFPDPACLAFFTAFEQNHLEQLEEQGELLLAAVDIFEGNLRFFIYCDDPEETVYDCAAFLKDSSLYKCEFTVVLNDNSKALKEL